MSTKKYLTLEEAARQLSMGPEELVRLRERGEIRGFADRGTWKFRSEDVEEFARSRDADSSPEVPIIDDKPGRKSPAAGERKGTGRFNKTSDSDVRLLLDETLVPGAKDSDPEVVLSQLGSSDSDVRLTDDVAGVIDSSSDSDVKLISTSSDMLLPSDEGSSDGSDSDVKLIAADSDSDVRLAKPASDPRPPRSDSDVRLVGTEDMATLSSESDLRLTDAGSSSDVGGSATKAGSSGSSTKLGSSTSSVNLGDSSSDESSVLLGPDSGIALDTGSGMKVGGGSSADSGITLQSLADSGISLEKVDSGISLASPMDSGIALDADSGIALDKDSGITLSADSGIRLDPDASAKTTRAPKKKGLLSKEVDEVDEDSTQVEVPMMDEEADSGYKLHEDSASKTNVVLFADEAEYEEEEEPVAPVSRKKGRADDSFALQESGVEFAEAEDFSDDDDLEVAEDVLTEEEGDLDEIDVFEPAEEDFGDSSIQSGESHAELQPGALAMRAPAAAEAPWDGLTFGILTISTVCLVLAGVMMYDLVRTEWYFDQNVVVGSALLDWVRGLFPTT
jgi:excisionase family DNA binding protein